VKEHHESVELDQIDVARVFCTPDELLECVQDATDEPVVVHESFEEIHGYAASIWV
jgi:hypothetical protein